MSSLFQIADSIRKCTRCPLWKHRLQPLAGVGNVNAKLMIVIESPDEVADRLGNLWASKTAKLLKVVLQNKNILFSDIFLTSLVKCSSGGSPIDLHEVEECSIFLTEQIKQFKSLEHIFVISQNKKLIIPKNAKQFSNVDELDSFLIPK